MRTHLLILSLVVILAIRVESLPGKTVNSKILEGNEKEDSNPEHFIKKRAIQCSNSGVAYGSTVGDSFADISGIDPEPCEVDIVEIRVLWGSVVDAIQVTYKTLDGVVITRPRQGGNGGGETVISLENGERITGAMGMICDFAPATLVHQLVFFSEKADGQKVVYGPYGIGAGTNCFPFAVNAKINSIYGVVTTRTNLVALGAIGFFYEDTGRARQST